MRLESLVRMAVAEEEFELRLETFAERGRRLELPESRGRRRCGCSASASRRRSSWRSPTRSPATRRRWSAPSPPTRPSTTCTSAPSTPWCSGPARTRTRRSRSSPACAATPGSTTSPPCSISAASPDIAAADAFNKGVTDVASPEVSENDTAKRVLELARAYRRQSAIRRALEKAKSSGLMDAATGLFTRDLFAAHLMRLASAARARNRPLSVCVLKVADRPEVTVARAGGWLDRAIPQIGAMIGRLVRAEDTAARLGPGGVRPRPARHQPVRRAAHRRAHRRGDRLHRLRGRP